MSDSTKILLKRTTELLNNTELRKQPISFGEPIFIDNNKVFGDSTKKCNSYIALGSPVPADDGNISKASLFKGFWDVTKANSLVFFKEDRKGLVDEENNPVYADKLVVTEVDTSGSDSDTRYYILCQPNISQESDENHGSIKKFVMGEEGRAGIFVSSRGVLYGAAWNDYAETRKIVGSIKPGDIVCEVGDGSLELSSKRLQPCSYVVSDTFGMVIGDHKDIPVAISGRVLVNMHEEKCNIGDCVCAGVDGKATIMTREEIKEFPDRILGIVTEIPTDYDEWNGVKINNRVWIKIK